MPPIPIEDAVKKELPIVSNAMVIGDKKKFLSMLLTLKVHQFNIDFSEIIHLHLTKQEEF